jgi:hypothetical protein
MWTVFNIQCNDCELSTKLDDGNSVITEGDKKGDIMAHHLLIIHCFLCFTKFFCLFTGICTNGIVSYVLCLNVSFGSVLVTCLLRISLTYGPLLNYLVEASLFCYLEFLSHSFEVDLCIGFDVLASCKKIFFGWLYVAVSAVAYRIAVCRFRDALQFCILFFFFCLCAMMYRCWRCFA